MILINVKNKQVVGESEFRRLLSNVSFPKPLTLDAVKPYGFSIVIPADVPELEPGQKAVAGPPVASADGYWHETFTIEGDVLTAKADQVRRKRDELLAATDWTQLNDVESPAGYVDYRQALRNITSQEGFPDNVIWPEHP